MARKLRVPTQALLGIAAIAKFSDRLPLLKSLANEMPPAEANPSTISSIFASRADVPLMDAQRIVTQIMALHGLRATFGLPVAQFYDALTQSLATDTPLEWRDDNLAAWEDAKAPVLDALDPTHPFNIIQKRTRLSYEHQNVFYDGSLITDIRPVFDENGRDVVQLYVGHSLEVEYFDGSDQRRIFFALDSADVEKLKRACERAQTKEATLKSKFKSLPWPVVTQGDDDD